METAQESESGQGMAEIDPAARQRLSGAGEVQASLEAVRSAQASARARARRETRWARVIAVCALTAMGVTAWAAVKRAPRARSAAVPKAAAVATRPAPASVAAPSIAPPPAEAPPAEAPAPAARPVVSAAAEAEGKVAMALCDAAFEQRSWTSIASTCATAFEARPDSAVAMRVAQAEHRHGHVAVAADWARKALTLDAGLPEAYVLVGRAEVAAGRPGPAAEAYGRYLKLAPRGWHASEARRAVRAVR
jgi:hypothetical protein